MGTNGPVYDKQAEYDRMSLRDLTSLVAYYQSMVDHPHQGWRAPHPDQRLQSEFDAAAQKHNNEHLQFLKLQVANRVGRAKC